ECTHNCYGNGECVAGSCHCFPGFIGPYCSRVDCADPACSAHGACHHGECHCNPGWGGASCEILKSTCPEQCSSHGAFNTDSGTCVCEANWTGADCSIEVCVVDCGPHGLCISGACHCEEGWTGPDCEQRDCHPRCIDHGVCREGKCDCHQGWTGEHCTIEYQVHDALTDGCPGLCNNNGRCILDQNVWHCICQSGWRGLGCDVATETLCSDGKDNEGDGLVDCMDPDCCTQISCQGQTYCRGSPDPAAVAGQGQSSSPRPLSKGFYERVGFLIG
uniref:Si:dkey-237h12.3 n=1 Tax=Gasterosteus aculeatus TaxID=69293 RepID=G3PW44_GASAC